MPNDIFETLISNQNLHCQPDCKNLYKKHDYNSIFSKTRNLEDQIKAVIEDLINKKALTTGISVVSGNEDNYKFYNAGFTSSDAKTYVNRDTIFDLASVSKLFLCFAFFSLFDNNLIDFHKTVGYYSGKYFCNLKDVTIYDLMHFNCTISTDKRITDCSFEEAIQQIRSIKVISSNNTYSDMPAIILGLLFEKVASVSYGSFICNEFIEKFGLYNTFWKRNGNNSSNAMSYDNEFRYTNGKLIKLCTDKFEVNDRKARVLSDNNRLLCGHAGLFSTTDDIRKFSTALLGGKVISEKSLYMIGNISDMPPKSKRFGYLSYTKNPINLDNEVFWGMGGNSFAISGYTGTYYMIDPINCCFCFIGGNKLNNRLTFCDNIDFLNSTNIIYTKDYVYIKDWLRDAICMALLKNKYCP